MADRKKMSVADILAAARAEKAAGASTPEAPAEVRGPAASAESASGDETAADVAPPPVKKPAAKTPAATAASGGRPSVAEIMKLARAKAAAEPVTASDAASAEQKPTAPAAKKAGGGASAPAAQPAAKMAALPKDTASILAAARAGAKPGPISKADAPPRPKPAAKAPAEKATKAPPRPVPPKPSRPAVPAKAAASTEDRRNFLSMAMGSFMAVGFTALSVTGGLFSLGLARFLFPNVLAEPPSRFKVGFKEAFPAGKVETKFVAQYGVWIVNSEFQGQEQIYALKTVCTHLGCTPNWLEAEQKFKCPCHGSGFYKDGINFEGPAPRPLERYAIRIGDDGQLEVDKSRAFQEELGQWADPASFVTA
jgi:cytochrome b6-f complex iron-sulfur subunit